MGALVITKEMKEIRQQQLEKIYEKTNKDIQRAVENGFNSICFPLDKSDKYYYEVRAEYESKGYKIKPTGYISGVWQLTEDMYW